MIERIYLDDVAPVVIGFMPSIAGRVASETIMVPGTDEILISEGEEVTRDNFWAMWKANVLFVEVYA